MCRRILSRVPTRFALLTAAAWLTACLPAQANALYKIDQTLAKIGFAVNTFGMFTTTGTFQQFDATFSLDFAAPEHSEVSVTIKAGSVAMAYPNAVEMLQSPDFFDVADHPAIHFDSTSVLPVSADRFELHGNLAMRGVTHPQTLLAVLTNRTTDAASGTEVSDFAVTGDIDRTAYGMVTMQDIVAKTVHLDIKMRLRIDPHAHS